ASRVPCASRSRCRPMIRRAAAHRARGDDRPVLAPVMSTVAIYGLPSVTSLGLERRRSDDLPAVTPAQLGRLALVHRRHGMVRPLLLLHQPARAGRNVEKQHTPGFSAAVLPRMRNAARHEGAGAGATDRDLVADLERDLAAQDVRHLVAVVMQMERALCP